MTDIKTNARNRGYQDGLDDALNSTEANLLSDVYNNSIDYVEGYYEGRKDGKHS